MVPAESFHLRGTSTKIPSRGLGTFQVDPKAYPIGSVKDSVRHALQVGYRHIDAALGYGWGSVERDVGQAVKESGIPREDIFIVTKLCKPPLLSKELYSKSQHSTAKTHLQLVMRADKKEKSKGITHFTNRKMWRLGWPWVWKTSGWIMVWMRSKSGS